MLRQRIKKILTTINITNHTLIWYYRVTHHTTGITELLLYLYMMSGYASNIFVYVEVRSDLNIVKKEDNRRDEMIYKVLYQESIHEIPVREQTKSLYIEAESIREVRAKLVDREYNIEYIQKLDGAHLEYEKQSDAFKMENI